LKTETADGGDDTYQYELERRALQLLAHPRVLEAISKGREALVDSLPTVGAESHALLESSCEEIAFFGILNGLNQDRSRPRIHYVERLPSLQDGIRIPGSRGMDDNPDTVYRIIPIDDVSKYILSGKAHADRPVVNDFSILSHDWVTIDNLTKSNLVLGEDRQFEISISPEPSQGRPNHLQSAPGPLQYVLVRDTLADWEKQRPNSLAVRRLGADLATPPPSERELMESVLFHVTRWFEETIRLHRLGQTLPANQLPQPEIRANYGMLVTQAYSVGYFDLQDDQALVITLRAGGARYVTVPVTNVWGITTDPVHHTTTLNTSQAAPNSDGSYTFVLSLTDPGIANWLDSDGLHQGFLFLRWAAFDGPAENAGSPSVQSRLVSLRELRRVLPPETPSVDRAFREKQLADRANHYQRRSRRP
jgi:hypothetical protein